MAKILVVDDDASQLELLKAVLEKDGHEVVLATDGQEALDTLADNPFDAVITDILMPNVDGGDLIREMHSVISGFVPVMVVTGGGRGELHRVEHLGVSASLEKPIDPEKLTLTVREMLEPW